MNLKLFEESRFRTIFKQIFSTYFFREAGWCLELFEFLSGKGIPFCSKWPRPQFSWHLAIPNETPRTLIRFPPPILSAPPPYHGPIILLEGCKGHTHKGHRENVLKVMNFRVVFSRSFQGVFRVFSSNFRVFSGCFSLCPFWVCSLDPFKFVWGSKLILLHSQSF